MNISAENLLTSENTPSPRKDKSPISLPDLAISPAWVVGQFEIHNRPFSTRVCGIVVQCREVLQ
jgi:hypothetical protein